MKILRYNRDRVGLLTGAGVVDVTDVFRLDASWPLPPGDIVISQLADALPKLRERLDGPAVPLASVRLEAPVANPSKIIGAPINYKAHIDESLADEEINQGRNYTTLETYGLFQKAVSSLAGPADELPLILTDRRTDHEVELAVVIGRKTRDIAEAEALSAVAGYCVGLDMSLRGKEVPSYRKSFDGYSILGPWLTTPDEVADPDDLSLSLEVNGEPRQASSTRMLILSVPKVIAYASRAYTLYPGDVIMTGTPEGVGPVAPGDTITARVEGLGELSINVTTHKGR